MVEDYYSAIAPGYDELYGAEQDEKLRELIARAKLPSHGMMLDVGCGTGRSKQFFPSFQWRGIEPSQGLIKRASEDARRFIEKGTGEKMPQKKESFDIVLSLTALQNFHDPHQGLKEMHRVMKPEGTLLLSFLKRSEKRDVLKRAVYDHFTVIDAWESAKDMMFICKS